MNVYGELASGIINFEFPKESGAPTLMEVSGWLDLNVGQLNTRLGTSFTGSSPEIDTMAQSIFGLMYMENFYRKQARVALYDVTSSVGADFITIKEGDSVVTRTNRNEVSKTYKGMAAEYADQIKRLEGQYRMYDSEPLQILPTTSTHDDLGYVIYATG